MRRRFLKCLEQGIECIARQHVNFVDNVDFVARRNRGVAHLFDDLAHVIDPGVRCRVHLDHVDMAAFGNRNAGLTHTARINRRPALPIRPNAVQRLGDQPRGRGFTDPPYPGHQKRMGQPVARDSVGKGAHHRFLSDQFGKGLRAIFARQHPIGLIGCGRGWFGRLSRRSGLRRGCGFAEQRILPRRLQLCRSRASGIFRQIWIGIAHDTKLGAWAAFVMLRMAVIMVEKEPSDPPQFTWAASFRT